MNKVVNTSLRSSASWTNTDFLMEVPALVFYPTHWQELRINETKWKTTRKEKGRS